MEQDSREDIRVQVGEAALVKAVRTLDQGGADTIPAKLEAIWKTLSRHRGHGFHAAEDMLLRWLLKTMAGSSPDAERVRRYPLTWNILSAIFSWIPTFSLAQSLADRRFGNVLKQTFKEAAASSERGPEGGQPKQGTNPADPGGVDIEMAEVPRPDRRNSSSPPDSRKRKRSATPTFELDAQRLPSGRLLTAQALIESLQTLLARCRGNSLAGQRPIERMGAEHIKSLFSAAAGEAVEMLVPFLAVCELALDSSIEVEFADGQTATWMSVFCSLWDLHLQTAADGSDFATHLYRPTAALLAKLSTAAPDLLMEDGPSIAINESARRQCARDLRRFLTRSFILPLRAAFLNRGSRDLLQLAIAVSVACAEKTHPLFFDLVTGLPPAVGERITTKDNDAWVQAVFDTLVTDGLKRVRAEGRDPKLEVVQSVVKIAADRLVRISLSSLQHVCKNFAKRDIGISWTLLLHMARLNPDVFLVAEEGGELLNKILAATLDSEAMSEETLGLASRFIVSLAEGYARTHDLSSFVKKWLDYLARSLSEEHARAVRIWSSEELRSAVAQALETSLNTKQLVDIVAWLSSHGDRGKGEVGARVLILESISRGISQEEYVDAASMDIFGIAYAESVPSPKSKMHAEMVAARWTIAQHAVSRGTLEDVKKIWLCLEKHTHELRKALHKTADLDSPDRFSAFKFCVAAWIANYPGGSFEDEAADMADVYLKKLDGAGAATQGVYMSWVGRNAPRLVSLLTGRKAEWPRIWQPPLWADDRDDLESPPDHGQAVVEQFRQLVLGNEDVLNEPKLSCELLNLLIDGIENWRSSSTKLAMRLLLDAPAEILGRPQRERAMARLVSQIYRGEDPSPVTPAQGKLVLSLMIKLMERPTYYEGMTFQHFAWMARDLSSTAWLEIKVLRGDYLFKERRECLGLFGRLMTLTLRQVTTGSLEKRERTYLVEAARILGTELKSHHHVEWKVMMWRIFISTVQGAPAAVKALEGEKTTLDDLKTQLLSSATHSLKAVCDDRWPPTLLPVVLEALEAFDALGDEMLSQEELDVFFPSLLGLSDSLLGTNSLPLQTEGWAIRGFLVKHFRGALGSPLQFGRVAMMSASAATGGDDSDPARACAAAAPASQDGPAGRMDQHAFISYLDVAIRSVDEDTRLDYLRELLHEKPLGGLNGTCQLLAIYQLVQNVKGSSPSSASQTTRVDGFDLATAHSMLCDRLLKAPSPGEFVLVARSVRLLLDHKAAAMTQWSVERTLSTVATLCSERFRPLPLSCHATAAAAAAAAATTPTKTSESPLPIKTIYPWLCRFVETIAKRHRRRLDGRFHILVTVLQALLRALICRPEAPAAAAQATSQASNMADSNDSRVWEKHAHTFSRLLALICEPSHTSLLQTSGGGGHSTATATATSPRIPAPQLDSERDRARRYAGQHMYLVVMQYVRLQVGARAAAVPRGVAAALEQPGLYAVLDVTAQDALAVMSDAMDPGGRAVVKDLYRRYQRFGKWTGV